MSRATETVRRYALEAIQLKFRGVVPESVVRDVTVTDVANFVADEMLVQLECLFYGVRASHTVAFWVPEDWWQHVKKRFAPEWALERWPVRYRRLHQTVHAARLFPDFVPPKVGERVAHIVEYVGTKHWS